MRQRARLLLLFLLLAPATWAAERPPAAAIASAHPLATDAGFEILRAGGNAFDAAVAVAAVLAVVEPANSGLGGGGFWLLHRAADGFETMVDGRERAPLAASRRMFLDRDGVPVSRRSLDGPLAAAIPGTPAALDHVARTYGRLTLAKSLAPAIRYARAGFVVSERHLRMIEQRLAALGASSAASAVFLDDGFPPRVGGSLRQPDLADTLERLAQEGRNGFYGGRVARRLVSGVRFAGGLWTSRDLEEYQVVERAPVRANYRGVRVTSAAPPSSGGIVLVEALNILGRDTLSILPRPQRAHLLIEAMRRAYRDRARYLGDPDHVTIDTERLLSPEYAAGLRDEIGEHASPSAMLGEPPPAGQNTTHFSVLDGEGNRVAVTLSLNTWFGSGFMPPGTGVLLNNEMDDFVIKPGVANLYGLTGGDANAIAPGKRPLSSMTPTFLETPDAVLVLGTPGGSRIISMVLLAALEFADGRGTLAEWLALPRFHHQYLPDEVHYEPGAFSADEIEALQALGHHLRPIESGYGNMQAVLWDKAAGRVDAASDPRGEGAAAVRVPTRAAREAGR